MTKEEALSVLNKNKNFYKTGTGDLLTKISAGGFVGTFMENDDEMIYMAERILLKKKPVNLTNGTITKYDDDYFPFYCKETGSWYKYFYYTGAKLDINVKEEPTLLADAIDNIF